MEDRSPRMKRCALEAGRQFVTLHYPDCRAAMLGGSARETASPHSDLDLLVVENDGVVPHQTIRRHAGWVVEAFVLTRRTATALFMEGIRSGNPTLQRLCVEGRLLRDDGCAGALIDEARADLEAGPLPMTGEELEGLRVELAEYVWDLSDERETGETLFIVNKLADLVPRFFLKARRCWMGEGKWLYRCLQQADPAFCEDWVTNLEYYYTLRDLEPLLQCIRTMLKPYGGVELDGVTLWGNDSLDSDEEES